MIYNTPDTFSKLPNQQTSIFNTSPHCKSIIMIHLAMNVAAHTFQRNNTALDIDALENLISISVTFGNSATALPFDPEILEWENCIYI